MHAPDHAALVSATFLCVGSQVLHSAVNCLFALTVSSCKTRSSQNSVHIGPGLGAHQEQRTRTQTHVGTHKKARVHGRTRARRRACMHALRATCADATALASVFTMPRSSRYASDGPRQCSTCIGPHSHMNQATIANRSACVPPQWTPTTTRMLPRHPTSVHVHVRMCVCVHSANTCASAVVRVSPM